MKPTPPPDRTVACLPAIELVLLCTPAGELVAQNMAGRVTFTRFADGGVIQNAAKGVRYWHKMATDAQLEAVREYFAQAAALGKCYANDWSRPARVPWWHPLEREPTIEEYRACPTVST